MTTYRMVDHGFPYKKIMCGRKWVGRVCVHAEGGYLGIIGKDNVRAATESAAFEEVAARALGYPSAAALLARNSAVRARKRAGRQALDALGQAFLHANVQTQVDMIDKFATTPQGATALVAAVARAIRK